MRRNQSHPDILRPHAVSDPQPSCYIEKEDYQRKSLDIHHHQHPSYEDSDNINSKDVLTDILIDPSLLVPAQTHSGDSLAPPSLNATPSSDYVPLIPMPPLLSTHRLLQNQLADLEASLNEETLNKVRTLYMNAATVPSVMQFPPCLIAYQLTLIESSIFRNIPPEALLSHSARTPHAKIVASTDFFNYITRAIEHSILLPPEASRRAEIINRWIKIATKCLALNNYQTLKAIVSALGTPPVQRLRRTWDCIPKKRMARLDLLNLLMSESDNYGKYREQIGLIDNNKKEDWSKPIIPFLGVFIHDITYLLAAATTKSKSPQDDPRIQDVLLLLTRFQLTPPYPSCPPITFIKSSLTKKHSFRPSTSLITNALHRTTASVKQRSNYIFGSSQSTANNNQLIDDDTHQQRRDIESDQQLITQYLLMRPWVNERTVDELSTLREPPKPRFGHSSSSTTNSTT
ncbi:ras guanine nucleotide exchange factor domain-containing protein, partial [Cunninghamella echinulata]